MAKDPYKYFRIEAGELLEGLTEGILELEKGTAAPDVFARLLRFAHTLKGAARVVKQPEIAELVHTVEGLLTTHRDTGRPLSKKQGSELLGLLDGVISRLQGLAPGGDVATANPVHPVAEEPIETLRVDMKEMDSLLRSVTEAFVQLGAVRKEIGVADRLGGLASLLLDQLATRQGEDGPHVPKATVRARSLAEELRAGLARFQRDLTVDLERVDGELAEIRDVAHRLRLIPAHTVFPSLDRAVRDAAQALGKRVDFAASGGEVRLDANVLALLRDALMHVARNAVAHGVETEGERVPLGKSPTARVRLEVERRGGRVTFACTDDGRGIDVEAVRKAAVARGRVLASEARALGADQVVALLVAGGLTTSGDVTELSGRGIGLDVVRETASRLKGEVRIRTSAGRGATIEIEVPVTVASMEGLVVEAAGALATIPLDAVRQTLRIRDTDVAHSTEGDSIVHDGKVIPFLPLDRALRRGGGSTSKNRRAWSAVVVHAKNRSVAVGVDRLLGTSRVVMRALPGLVEADAVVSGASLDAEGNPQLVLDPSGLIAAGERSRGAAPVEAAPRPAPVLIIDDSLTTRMLEQSILGSAGYDVELATSAEEGLAKARDRRYSLFIVDVEMPGMDGFGFVAQTRSDPALRDIPAILVTSRNAPEDKRRGEQVGARAYIVKGEFDQGKLLETIRALIG